MKNSKMIRMLSHMDALEIRRFTQFIQSPYHSSHEREQQFGELVLSEYPDFEEKSISKSSVFAKLFEREDYKEQKINDLMSYLVTAIHSFWLHEEFSRDDCQQRIYLLRSLRERKLNKEFLRQQNLLHRKLEELPHDKQYYFQLFQLEHECDQYYLSSSARDHAEVLQKKVEALDIFYLSAKLRTACEMINRKIVLGTDYDVPQLEVLCSQVADHPRQYEDVPAVSIYYLILLGLLEPDAEQHFSDLVARLENESGAFSASEARELYDYAQNYCIRKINSGRPEYSEALFGIYQKLLDSKLILEEGFLSQWDYKNIVAIGLRIHKYDWVRDFLEAGREWLRADSAEVAYPYNLAVYHYERGSFSETLKLLRGLPYTDLFYELGGRSLLLKIYFEQQEDELLQNTIKAFRLFLKRSKQISSYQQTIYLNLLRYTNKLCSLRARLQLSKTNKWSEALSQLRKQIESQKQIANLPWLLGQLAETEKLV